jgi:hypothetical protein
LNILWLLAAAVEPQMMAAAVVLVVLEPVLACL